MPITTYSRLFCSYSSCSVVASSTTILSLVSFLTIGYFERVRKAGNWNRGALFISSFPMGAFSLIISSILTQGEEVTAEVRSNLICSLQIKSMVSNSFK